MHRSAVVAALALPLCLSLLVLCGCGGHAPTLPGPDSGRILSGIVNLGAGEFVVAVGETVACVGDVTIRCGSARIEGALLSRAATGQGTNGSSITIESQGDIIVTGRIVAADGTGGPAERDGGDGGDVTLVSSAGSITLGTVPARNTAVWGGHAGDGGGGIYGGAGGEGGTVTLECRAGTLTLHQSPGLLRMGNGGDGGDAVIVGAAMASYDPPDEPTNDGGRAGDVVPFCQAVTGAEVIPVPSPVAGGPAVYVVVGEGVTLGGEGGAGGDVQFGETATTSTARQVRVTAGTIRTATLSSEPPKVCGGDGASGPVRGGDGGEASAILGPGDVPPTAGAFGWSAQAQGGRGGWASHTRYGTLDEVWAAMSTNAPTYGGAGGIAVAVGGPGANGAPGASGGIGGSAHADGGNGGLATPDDVGHRGPGGDAVSIGGRGGNGGHNCTTPGPGGDGGNGGTAYATGGDSPEPGPSKGGDASATSGAGGDGGNGRPPGAGGLGLASSMATAGEGNPEGTATVKAGEHGSPGHQCPSTGKPRIAGRVTDKTGAAVRSLDIKWAWKYAMTEPRAFGRVTPSQAWGFATTDANGWYVVPDLDPGVYWVEPMGDPGGPDFWNPPARLVSVNTADVPDQSFQLTTATTQYTITVGATNDNTGYGVPGERLRLVREGHNTWEQTTDGDGKATFAGLWPGVYNALPPATTGYTYQPASMSFILFDQDRRGMFRVTPTP